MKLKVKYSAFNPISMDIHLCTSKASLANKVGCHVATIRRYEAINQSFIIGDWYIFIDTFVDKIDRGGFTK